LVNGPTMFIFSNAHTDTSAGKSPNYGVCWKSKCTQKQLTKVKRGCTICWGLMKNKYTTFEIKSVCIFFLTWRMKGCVIRNESFAHLITIFSTVRHLHQIWWKCKGACQEASEQRPNNESQQCWASQQCLIKNTPKS